MRPTGRVGTAFGVAVTLGLAALTTAGGQPATLLPHDVGLRIVIDTVFYEAEGRERRQWVRSMRAGAQRAGLRAPYFAYTRSQATWSYASSRSGGAGCAARLPIVELSIRYTMPRLVADSAIAEEDVLEWRRYVTSLWRHEEGHALRAYREASEMRDSLVRLRAPSCAAMNATVARVMGAVERKHRALQQAYDTRTRHGARQGAVLLMPGVTRFPLDTSYRDTEP